MDSLRALWYSFRMCRVPGGGEAGLLVRLVAAARLCVLPMTFYSVTIGAGLAWLLVGRVSWSLYLALLAGFSAAHLLDNLVNDYFDYRSGVDEPAYFRSLYGPHPFLDGVLGVRELRAAALAVLAFDAALAAYLSLRVTPLVGVLALIGAAVMASYAGVGVDAKRLGIGELLVAVVWGPVMAGGTLLALAGSHPPEALALYAPYATSVSLVLIGKHMDKYEFDRAKGVPTLPVRLGLRRARMLAAALSLAIPPAAAAAFYAVIKSPLSAALLAPLLTAVVASRFFYLKEKPNTPPPKWEAWPLWYVAASYAVMDSVGRATLAVILAVGLWTGGHEAAAAVVLLAALTWEAASARAIAGMVGVTRGIEGNGKCCPQG